MEDDVLGCHILTLSDPPHQVFLTQRLQFDQFSNFPDGTLFLSICTGLLLSRSYTSQL